MLKSRQLVYGEVLRWQEALLKCLAKIPGTLIHPQEEIAALLGLGIGVSRHKPFMNWALAPDQLAADSQRSPQRRHWEFGGAKTASDPRHLADGGTE